MPQREAIKAMLINIFDVGHGGCSMVTCPNGTRMMIDCGFRSDPPWFPSVSFKGSQIDLLALLNLDEDHVRDLPYLWRDVSICSMFSNPTITANALATVKRAGGMGEGVKMMHSILEHFGAGLIGRMACGETVRAWAYFNRYGVDFSDTNNLSLAVFIRYGAFTILFAGDLEAADWRALLRHSAFATDLTSVTMFVTSHHGRENGCCEEVFQFCHPDVFVISDAEHVYASQDTTDWYRRRARGIPVLTPWQHSSRQQRFVLTTRCDGTLRVGVQSDGRYLVIPERAAPELNWPLDISDKHWLSHRAQYAAASWEGSS
jgi:beta-lactamase superfamily II metal-dependent hydrolase